MTNTVTTNERTSGNGAVALWFRIRHLSRAAAEFIRSFPRPILPTKIPHPLKSMIK